MDFGKARDEARYWRQAYDRAVADERVATEALLRIVELRMPLEEKRRLRLETRERIMRARHDKRAALANWRAAVRRSEDRVLPRSAAPSRMFAASAGGE